MTTPTTHPDHLSLGERLARDVAAYKAAGGHVERLAPGVCNWDSLTNRQKINPQVCSENREAQRMLEGKPIRPNQPSVFRSGTRAVAPKPTLKPPRRRAERQPKPAAVSAGPRKRPSTAERAARRGLSRGKRPQKSNEMLALLAKRGPMRCKDIMVEFGWKMNPTNQMLWRLKNLGLLVSTGTRGTMKFDLAPIKAEP